jgi:hypothetical protein
MEIDLDKVYFLDVEIPLVLPVISLNKTAATVIIYQILLSGKFICSLLCLFPLCMNCYSLLQKVINVRSVKESSY